MDADDQRALAGEFGGVGTIEKARDGFLVEAAHFDEFGFDIGGGIEPAGFALRPARDGKRFGVDGISVGRAFGGIERETNRAPRCNLDATCTARRERGHSAHGAAGNVHDAHPVGACFIDSVGNEAAVRRDVERVDVPFLFRAARREFAGFRIERAEALKVRTFVAGHPQRAVGGRLRVAISDRLFVVADGCHRAAGEVERVKIGLGNRYVIADDRGFAIGHEIGNAPAATLDLRHQPVGFGIARVHHVKIGIGAVATGGRVADQRPILIPAVEAVAAFAIGKQRQLPVLQCVDLEKLAAAGVLVDDEGVAFGRPAAAHRLGFEADLAAVHHRRGDTVQLRDIAEACADQHRFVGHVPARKGCGAKLHIGPRFRRERDGHGRRAVGDDGGRLGHVGKCGRGDQGGSENETLHDGSMENC